MSKDRLQIDAKGLKCPMPVIKLQQAVRKAETGTEISIACTDKGAEKDIGSWSRVNKHHLLSVENMDYGLLITIKVNGLES
ncbi:sulfurtransferase TusA family protein [Thiomicrorhabdus sp. 6S2-11]|jgi:tRNA 2-thiouridine synthesizing protein A|uniref:Sulfurtransferase TusA family protein n=1 Tax=Thiomicrorhabdus marina TaxID=2818442 RepID=A0ABS3Q434_9GAMM|nr:sulfurtransferase TusA family protein [Thiomicrorhabdus marina]MBO1927079.1 sulfurtransferase TusA family protein [Thiomicrorhabdus marina]